MTSKRTIENKLGDLESETQTNLNGEAMWEWINELRDRDGDIPRPPDYFPDGAEWNDDVREMHEKMADHAPELAHLSPPEAYILSYMDVDTIRTLCEVLDGSTDSEVEAWWEEATNGE
jgi:hypothetical protein